MAKIKKEKLTQEEITKMSLERELSDIRNQYIPEPSMVFKIGERVQRGAIEKSIVLDILDNGKIYLLEESGVKKVYHELTPYNNKHYASWLDIETYRTKEENDKLQIFTDEDDIRLSFSQRDISGLFSIAYHFGLDFNPSYQRDFCWTIDDKIKLIDSIFNRIDIGKFVFIQKAYSFKKPLYEVLDGKQRMRALMDFYENRFSYKGIYYKDLCRKDNYAFDSYPVSVCIVDDHHMTEEYKLKYFLKLNVGGVPQSLEHLAKVEKMYLEMKKKV
jgi:hypothetical protein